MRADIIMGVPEFSGISFSRIPPLNVGNFVLNIEQCWSFGMGLDSIFNSQHGISNFQWLGLTIFAFHGGSNTGEQDGDQLVCLLNERLEF